MIYRSSLVIYAQYDIVIKKNKIGGDRGYKDGK